MHGSIAKQIGGGDGSVRTGFWGFLIMIRGKYPPQDPILIIKAPTLQSPIIDLLWNLLKGPFKGPLF